MYILLLHFPGEHDPAVALFSDAEIRYNPGIFVIKHGGDLIAAVAIMLEGDPAVAYVIYNEATFKGGGKKGDIEIMGNENGKNAASTRDSINPGKFRVLVIHLELPDEALYILPADKSFFHFCFPYIQYLEERRKERIDLSEYHSLFNSDELVPLHGKKPARILLDKIDAVFKIFAHQIVTVKAGGKAHALGSLAGNRKRIASLDDKTEFINVFWLNLLGLGAANDVINSSGYWVGSVGFNGLVPAIKSLDQFGIQLESGFATAERNTSAVATHFQSLGNNFFRCHENVGFMVGIAETALHVASAKANENLGSSYSLSFALDAKKDGVDLVGLTHLVKPPSLSARIRCLQLSHLLQWDLPFL